MKLALFVACAALLVTTARSDENLWKVYHTPDDSITDCTLDSLAGEMLYVTSNGVSLAVPVDSVTGLRFERRAELGSSIGKGMVVGFAAGALATMMLVRDGDQPFYGITKNEAMGFMAFGGAWTGGWVGLAVGLIAAIDPRYDLRALPPREKRERLSSLIGQ
jgi:hypothetical protein